MNARLEHLIHLPRPEEVLPALLRGGLTGLLCGLVVGLFRWSHLKLSDWSHVGAGNPAYLFGQAHPALWWLALIAIGVVVSLLMERLPQIRSSGIPLVEDAEEDSVAGQIAEDGGVDRIAEDGGVDQVAEEYSVVDTIPKAKDVFFPWGSILWAKFVATWLVLVGGLSVGREGPCIEMGAAVGMGVDTLTRADAKNVHPRGNINLMAGAAAGLSAAFGAPLGGVAFVIEEMRCHTTPLMLVTILTAALTANAVLGVFGIGPMFAYTEATAIPLSLLWLTLPMGLTLGLAGAAYNTVLLACTRVYTNLPFPPFTRALPPLLAAGGLFFVMPRLLGGGEILIDSLPGQTDTLTVLAMLLLLKFFFSLLCAASSVPGGLLMPMLCLGGMMGGLALRSFTSAALPPEIELWAVLGMVGFFAASVRAPLTGVALTLEMTGAWHALLPALIIAFVAAKAADLLKSEPIYEALRGK